MIASRRGKEDMEIKTKSGEVICTIPGSLVGASFQGLNFREADFRGANLQWADFRGVRLWRPDFRGANFRGADFRAANLRADLRGANLQGAQGILRVECAHPWALILVQQSNGEAPVVHCGCRSWRSPAEAEAHWRTHETPQRRQVMIPVLKAALQMADALGWVVTPEA